MPENNVTDYLLSPEFTTNVNNVDAGGCPKPFISASLIPYTGGYEKGRNCAQNPLVTNGGSLCCIPCPIIHYTYTDDFDSLVDGAAWLSVAGFILSFFLLVSFAILPVKYTKRSFLSIALLVSIMILELGFIVPLSSKTYQCHDIITPNGMYSSGTCAFGGAAIAFGLLAYTLWILVRSLFMHLQIVWNKTPGKLSYWAANVAVWSITIGLTAAALAHVGVSFRLGGYCHLNTGTESTYWGWVLAFGGIALLLQIWTFLYCCKVYLQSTIATRNDPSQRSVSVTSSSRARTARATLKRLQQVLVLQWRAIAIVLLAIFTTAFVTVIFIVVNGKLTESAVTHTERLIPWVLCIIATQDNMQCLSFAAKFNISEDITLATLYLLNAVGVEAFLLMFRWDIMEGWCALIRNPKKTWRDRNAHEDTDFIMMNGSKSKSQKGTLSSMRRMSDTEIAEPEETHEMEQKPQNDLPSPVSPTEPVEAHPPQSGYEAPVRQPNAPGVPKYRPFSFEPIALRPSGEQMMRPSDEQMAKM